MPKQGRRRKKTRTHVQNDTTSQSALASSKEEVKVPKSLVIRRGKCDHSVGDLVDDVRKLMLPFTALNFKEEANNRKLTLAKYCKDLALPMGVSHILEFSQRDDRLNLRLARTPEGPTMSFRVHEFSLCRNIRALQRRPVSNYQTLLHHPPIVVTNNFGDANAPPQLKLMRITFQNMFPAINVANVRLKECRRVVLFHLLENDGDEGGAVVQIRHYAIKATPVGVNKKVRRLVQAKNLPNLSKVDDVADYLAATGGYDGAASDSEAEDDPSHVVKLSQNYSGQGNRKTQRSALKLVELGPRLSMELVKIEKGLGGGDVMYHSFVTKTPEESKALKERKEQEARLKKQRREEQTRNVEKRKKEVEEKREAKRQRRELRGKEALEELRRTDRETDEESDDTQEDNEDVHNESDAEEE